MTLALLRQHAWRWVVDRLPEGAKVPILSGPLRGRSWYVSHHGYYDPGNPDKEGPGVRDYGYISGRYQQHIQRAFVAQCKPGSWVYDIGAHHGFYSLLALVRGANVVAVEGDPASHRSLDLNVLRCRERWPFDGQQARLHPHYATAHTDWTAYPSPDLVKIDVDGHECDVLSGVLRCYEPRVIIIEVRSDLYNTCKDLAAGYDWTQAGEDDYILTRGS